MCVNPEDKKEQDKKEKPETQEQERAHASACASRLCSTIDVFLRLLLIIWKHKKNSAQEEEQQNKKNNTHPRAKAGRGRASQEIRALVNPHQELTRRTLKYTS